MRLLLDTHVLLWWLSDDARLGAAARARIANPANIVFVSAATIWEAVIKQALGKLAVDGDLAREVLAHGFAALPITFEHAAETLQLPPLHRDPFDRILVAQARVESLHLLTDDAKILRYPVTSIHA